MYYKTMKSLFYLIYHQSHNAFMIYVIHVIWKSTHITIRGLEGKRDLHVGSLRLLFQILIYINVEWHSIDSKIEFDNLRIY
jgi:hypothetical protein